MLKLFRKVWKPTQRPKAWDDLWEAAQLLSRTKSTVIRDIPVYLHTERGFSSLAFPTDKTILLQYAAKRSRNPEKIFNALVMYFSNEPFWNEERDKHQWSCLHYHLVE